ncbi:MAG: hypothetical protein Q8P56_06190 [Candidatus Uhrbacteria bacterium]|nr:hypothetical protein [Candidatus Uhrbacteria bacterium]
MEQNTQQQASRQQIVYRELDTIDDALHRLKEHILSLAGMRGIAVRSVLDRTGGVARNKYSKHDILKWQKETRDDWGS